MQPVHVHDHQRGDAGELGLRPHDEIEVFGQLDIFGREGIAELAVEPGAIDHIHIHGRTIIFERLLPAIVGPEQAAAFDSRSRHMASLRSIGSVADDIAVRDVAADLAAARLVPEPQFDYGREVAVMVEHHRISAQRARNQVGEEAHVIDGRRAVTRLDRIAARLGQHQAIAGQETIGEGRAVIGRNAQGRAGERQVRAGTLRLGPIGRHAVHCLLQYRFSNIGPRIAI